MMLKREFKSALMSLSFNLAKSMKASIELALIPVPLFMADFRIVLQISPGILWV